MRVVRGLLAALLFVAGFGVASPQAGGTTSDEAREIAASAYVYFYPLVTMDITRRQATNVTPGAARALSAPMNQFFNAPEYPPADFKLVVRPNFDTLYSSAWLDLTKEPIVLSLPDTHGRYYLMPMMDMWTDVFASPGWRTTGTLARSFLIVPPGWTGTVPSGMTRIDAPTPYVWILGRTQTNGPPDYAAVHEIQRRYVLTPLSQWGKAPGPPRFKTDPTIDMKTPPKAQVDAMSGQTFFTYAAELLKAHPPHLTDEPMIASLRRIGFTAGRSLNFATLDPVARQALSAAPAAGKQLMAQEAPRMASVANGWQMNLDSIGVYGDNYVKRAITAEFALGANTPEDAVYPFNLFDGSREKLSGANKYRIHFAAGSYPPARAFWSVTLYDSDGYPVANQLNRFSLSSWMPLVKNADGSLDLYVQHDDPGQAADANWLPAPSGPFNLTMRIYAPTAAVLYGQWAPPPVVRQ